MAEWVIFVADDAAEILDPAQPLVAGVPDQSQSAAGPQHPGDLLDGTLGIEPMPSLRDEHRVHAVVGKWDLFGSAEQCGGVGQRTAEQLEHLWDRVDGDDVQSPLDESGGQLAGACTEVEYVSGVRWQQPVD